MPRYEVIRLRKKDRSYENYGVTFCDTLEQACAVSYSILQGWSIEYSIDFLRDHLDDIDISKKAIESRGVDDIECPENNLRVFIIDLEYVGGK